MGFTMGSLFDGSGGFPLAASLCGITPLWAAEVEPYPIAVTRSRFPAMKHLGDITKVNGAEIEPVDIITFGSPCQDLSVAGQRKGLKHEGNGDEETTRSGLFMEAIRIIKEMRGATNGRYPAFAVWENVQGAFSSNKGEDFRIVLEEFVKIVHPTAKMPIPDKTGWAYADIIMGDGWSIAYRLVDAQYWGVPQRRKRIYLVADFRGERAGEILFEREGLQGYFTQGRTPWQGASADAEGCAGIHDSKRICVGADIYKQVLTGETSSTLGVNCGMSTGRNGGIEKRAYSINHQGGNAEQNLQMMTSDGNVAGTLDASYYKGTGVRMGRERLYIAYCFGNGQANDATHLNREVCNTLNCLVDPMKVLIESTCHPRYIVRRLTPTECARLQGFPDKWGHPDKKNYLTDSEYKFWQNVRNADARINGKTEKEYSREQMLKWYNKLHSDSAEYKMWGNGIALPNALYVIQGIADALKER